MREVRSNVRFGFSYQNFNSVEEHETCEFESNLFITQFWFQSSSITNKYNRLSQSAVETKLSAPPSPTSPTASKAALSNLSSPTGAKHGAILSTTRNSAGSDRKKASFTSLSVPSLTPSGTCGPKRSASPSGESSPT